MRCFGLERNNPGGNVMLKAKVKKLNKDHFSMYGSYVDMLNPHGYSFGKPPILFYRDMLQQNLGQHTSASFSVCTVYERPLIIDCSEYHNHCYEAILPLDGDLLMHVGPAVSDEQPPIDQIEVFHVPKGTMVVVNPGVWHQAAFPFQCDRVNILCILPERTYMNDCFLRNFPEDNQVEIELV
jgi:ureidoglycolate lyase